MNTLEYFINHDIVTYGNQKLGFIGSINQLPIVTCRKNAPCRKLCYACRGNFAYKNTKQALQLRYDLYKHNPQFYFDKITIETSNPLKDYKRFFRWHASGDIVDKEYFLGMIKVAQKNENTIYLCFTKKFEIVNDFLKNGGIIPQNLTIVFSDWKGLKMDNPYNLPIAYVDSISENIPTNIKKCNNRCSQCMNCWKLQKNESVLLNKH